MAEEVSYHDGDIVWVKMNKLWWPGEVHGSHRLPSDFFDQFKKPPLVIVKFFQEQNYHYVNQLHQIARFNCAKKNDFIKKGLDLYYAKHSYMEVFPADVAIAEKRTGGNPNIIYSKEFMPVVKADKTIPVSASKGTTSRSRRGQEVQSNTPSIPRVMIKPDHDTRILVPSVPAASTPLATTPPAVDNKYKCTLCNFSTNRINTFVWHQKTHNSPKTPQVTVIKKCPINQAPSTSTVNPEEEASTPSTSVQLQSKDENNVSGIDELESKPVKSDEVTEPVEEAATESIGDLESVDKAPEPAILPEKTKGKRLRKTNETRPKSSEKPPKTDNKLRKILDDWSDDEFGEAGPSGLKSNKSVNSTVLDTGDDEDIDQEFSVKKKLKFDNDRTCNSNGNEEKKSDLVSDDQSPKILSSELSTSDVQDEGKNKAKSTEKDEAIIGQNVQIETKDATSDEVKPQTRFSLRSGRATLTNENSTPIPPKRRGRAKRNANDSVKSEVVPQEIKEIEIEPMLPEKSETIENIAVSSADIASDESVQPASVQPKSNSKTSRKGKPRRKEEIKLANNISVAVLVEKTNSCPSTDKESEQKPDIPSEDIAHKKIRYMSHSSTDDHRKSVEASKLPEQDMASNNHADDQIIVDPPGSQEEKDAEIAKEPIHSSDQNEENEANENTPSDVLDVSMSEPSTSVLILDNSELTATEGENSTVTESSPPDEQHVEHVTQQCYKRKSTPKMNSSSDQLDASTSSPTDDHPSIDTYESPSSSNLRQRAPKRYENTRNRRKSDRRTTSDDDFSAIVKEIDVNCEKNDRARHKSVDLQSDTSKLSDNLNDSGKEPTDSTNLFDQSGENSNSKTSTPEKADSSKELDCFDFTEDECLKLPPSVLNLRKRLPPGKVFELEDIDKIEEQRKIDEETARVAQQREEENQKLHAELENLLNSTTPVTLPEIPVGPKVHENFPERRAEKDPEKSPVVNETDIKERMLPPKERNKRIFKYRNRNRRPDSDAKVTNASGNVSDNKDNNYVQQAVRLSVDEMEVEAESETDIGNNPPAHDLKLEIAETLINFPLLSPQTDVNEQSIEKLVTKPPNKRKESVKSTRVIKKLRSAATVETLPDVCKEETIAAKESNELLCNTTKDSLVQDSEHMNQEPGANLDDLELQCTLSNTKSTVTETVAANTTMTPTASTSVRDFSRIRLIEKIDNHTTTQSIGETDSSETHQLPTNKTVIITQTEGNSFITRIPKKRKSQQDDDVPAFVIERPKDHPDDASESNNKHTPTNKEPKSFVVTKTIKKQVSGDVPKQNTVIAGSGVVEAIERNVTDSQPETKTVPNNTQLVEPTSNLKTKVTQIPGASEISSIASPVITSSHPTSNKSKFTKNAQKRSAAASTAVSSNSSVLGSLAANRPCTIAPAKKASYRRPTDMTGVQQKQIGIDGNGNPVMIYTKINPTVTQSPPVTSQVTFPTKRNEPIPSTSQLVQSYSTSLQSNQGNQFVITSKGALITNTPFITTTHSTQFNQPTLTNRSSNIQVHTHVIRSPNNPQVFQQQQQQHPSPQSNQIIIQTKPTSSLSPISSTASVQKQPPNRRSVVNKAKVQEQSNDRLINPSGHLHGVGEDSTTSKKRVVRRVSKNQSSATATSTQQMQSNQQQQQVVLNSEINHIGAIDVPPLIPLSDQTSSRKQSTKQQPTQMTFVQEPQVQSKTAHVDVVEQQQENTQEYLALPGDTPGFGGPPGSYFLCKMNEMGVYAPIDRQPLYLDVTDNTNLLKPNAPDDAMITEAVTEIETEIPQQSLFELNNEAERVIAANQSVLTDQDANNPKYLINISDGQQLLVDQQSLMALANGEEFPQFVTSDGHQIILQSGQHDILSAIAFAEDVGLIAGQQILIPEDDLAVIQGQGGNHDILAAALAGTEAFSQEQFIDNVLIRSTNGSIEDPPMVYHTMPPPAPLTNAVTNETNAVLTQPPIMSTLEHPTKTDRISPNNSLELLGQNLDESLAVIGVTTSNTNVPTSLELPITITNPAIASKTTMSTIYPNTVTNAEHDLDYDLFSSSLPITHHHLTQSLAINDNYRTVNVINSVGGIDLGSNTVGRAVSQDRQFIERN